MLRQENDRKESSETFGTGSGILTRVLFGLEVTQRHDPSLF